MKVTATFGAAGAAEKAYSFDGGKTWQSAASYTFKVTKDTTLAKDSVPGARCLRSPRRWKSTATPLR